MARTLFQKVWDLHKVRTLPGQTQPYRLHLVEVISPQAFAARERGWPSARLNDLRHH
jgi:hypothetical protein